MKHRLLSPLVLFGAPALFLVAGCKLSSSAADAGSGSSDAGIDGATGGPPQTINCDDEVIPVAFTHTKGKAVDYVVTCNLPIERATTVGPGTVIAFQPNSSFQVRAGGSLKAVGTKDEPILLQPEKSGASWVGVYFFTTSKENALEFVRIKSAGEKQPNLQASVLVGASSYADGTVAIRDCVFEGSAGPGLYVGEVGTLMAFERTTIEGSAEAPIVTTAHNVGALASAGNKLTGNKVDRVEVVGMIGKAVIKDQTWAKLDVPYFVKNHVGYGGVQTIAPGVTILMEADAALQADATNGKLVAVGTAAEPITIRSFDDMPGKWAGLMLGHDGNEFANCRVAGGGTRGVTESKGNILAYGAAVSIRDCVIEGSASWGVFNAGGSVKLGANVTFKNNAKGDVGGDN